jgi:tRNA/tmRNA/rRNA uracil-C5-methylase (TrmA/RlmC/RlmD family)
VIVDPPRSGLDKNTINQLIKINPKKIIYISCDPVTLARDLNLLKEKYKINEITPVDMFVNTYHVETVVLMSRVEK